MTLKNFWFAFHIHECLKKCSLTLFFFLISAEVRKNWNKKLVFKISQFFNFLFLFLHEEGSGIIVFTACFDLLLNPLRHFIAFIGRTLLLQCWNWIRPFSKESQISLQKAWKCLGQDHILLLRTRFSLWATNDRLYFESTYRIWRWPFVHHDWNDFETFDFLLGAVVLCWISELRTIFN